MKKFPKRKKNPDIKKELLKKKDVINKKKEKIKKNVSFKLVQTNVRTRKKGLSFLSQILCVILAPAVIISLVANVAKMLYALSTKLNATQSIHKQIDLIGVNQPIKTLI